MDLDPRSRVVSPYVTYRNGGFTLSLALYPVGFDMQTMQSFQRLKLPTLTLVYNNMF